MSGPTLSWRLIMKWFLRSFSSLPLIHSRRVVVSYKRKYVHELLVNRLFKPAQEKSVVRWTDRPAMTIAVDLGRKATKQKKTKKLTAGRQNSYRNDRRRAQHVLATFSKFTLERPYIWAKFYNTNEYVWARGLSDFFHSFSGIPRYLFSVITNLSVETFTTIPGTMTVNVSISLVNMVKMYVFSQRSLQTFSGDQGMYQTRYFRARLRKHISKDNLSHFTVSSSEFL